MVGIKLRYVNSSAMNANVYLFEFDLVINVGIKKYNVSTFFGEFDPGSERTLAACLTHASRTVTGTSVR